MSVFYEFLCNITRNRKHSILGLTIVRPIMPSATIPVRRLVWWHGCYSRAAVDHGRATVSPPGHRRVLRRSMSTTSQKPPQCSDVCC